MTTTYTVTTSTGVSWVSSTRPTVIEDPPQIMGPPVPIPIQEDIRFLDCDGGRADNNVERYTNDCVIRAIAIASGVRYADVIHTAIWIYPGYQTGNILPGNIALKLFEKYGWYYVRFPRSRRLQARMLPKKGVCILHKDRHAMPVINRVLLDHEYYNPHYINGIWVPAVDVQKNSRTK